MTTTFITPAGAQRPSQELNVNETQEDTREDARDTLRGGLV